MIFLPVIVAGDEATFTVAYDEFGKDPVAGYAHGFAVTRTGIGDPVDKDILAAMFSDFQVQAQHELDRLQAPPVEPSYYEADTGKKLTKQQGEDAYADAFPKVVAEEPVIVEPAPDVIEGP